MNAVLKQGPTPVGVLGPDLHPALQAAVSKAIEKSPAQRYQTLAEFVGDLTLFKNRVWPSRSPVGDQTVIAPVLTGSELADAESTIAVREHERRQAVEAALTRARANLASGDFE